MVADGGARGFVLQIGARYFHGFVVRRGDAAHGFVDRCPHMGVPLASELDRYRSPLSDHIACGWHGALFLVEDGRCVGGPCAGIGLDRVAGGRAGRHAGYGLTADPVRSMRIYTSNHTISRMANQQFKDVMLRLCNT